MKSNRRTDGIAADRETSRTALGVAALRAYHYQWDDEPKILEDSIAAQLLDPDVRDRLLDIPASPGNSQAAKLRLHVVLRSRYAEDRLKLAVERGVKQCVILGAGLDTFAYRQPSWASGLRIFEVDSPASQRFKRDRLARAGIAIPENVTLAPIDFETTSLADGLERARVDHTQPAFFSWLGVMVYLTEPAIDRVFRYVAECARGSEIAFTFATPQQRGPSMLAKGAAALGEPWRTFFEPEILDAKLCVMGYREIEMLAPEEADRRYDLGRRRDGLQRPVRTTIGTAIV